MNDDLGNLISDGVSTRPYATERVFCPPVVAEQDRLNMELTDRLELIDHATEPITTRRPSPCGINCKMCGEELWSYSGAASKSVHCFGCNWSGSAAV